MCYASLAREALSGSVPSLAAHAHLTSEGGLMQMKGYKEMAANDFAKVLQLHLEEVRAEDAVRGGGKEEEEEEMRQLLPARQPHKTGLIFRSP